MGKEGGSKLKAVKGRGGHAFRGSPNNRVNAVDAPGRRLSGPQPGLHTSKALKRAGRAVWVVYAGVQANSAGDPVVGRLRDVFGRACHGCQQLALEAMARVLCRMHELVQARRGDVGTAPRLVHAMTGGRGLLDEPKDFIMTPANAIEAQEPSCGAHVEVVHLDAIVGHVKQ